MDASGRHRAHARHARKRNRTHHYLGVAAVVLGSVSFAAYKVQVAANAPVVFIDAAALAGNDNTDITVHSVSHEVRQISVTIPIAYDREITEDANIAKGTQIVKVPGLAGLARVVYSVVFVDGHETNRTALHSTTVREPRNAIVLEGTGDPNKTEVTLETAAQGVGSPEGNRAYAQVYIKQKYGWGDDQFACLVKLWKRESNWRTNAKNKHSGAYGIPQALPGRKMATIADDWRTNPITQMKWGAGYIEGRYDTPCGAWAHSERKGWY